MAPRRVPRGAGPALGLPGPVRRAASYALSVAALLALWHLAARAIESPALPTPGETFVVLGRYLPELAPAFLVSLRRVLVSTGIAAVLALPLGLALGRSPRADALLSPALNILYPIPKAVLLPVFLVLLGLGDASKIALMATTVFFQVLVGVRDAARNVPRDALLAARSLGASRMCTCLHVVVPAVMPQLFTALRVGTGTAVALLFLAEAIAGSSGLGYFIVDSWALVNYPRMFAGMVGMAVLGVGVYEALACIERALTPWRRVEAPDR